MLMIIKNTKLFAKIYSVPKTMYNDYLVKLMLHYLDSSWTRRRGGVVMINVQPYILCFFKIISFYVTIAEVPGVARGIFNSNFKNI